MMVLTLEMIDVFMSVNMNTVDVGTLADISILKIYRASNLNLTTMRRPLQRYLPTFLYARKAAYNAAFCPRQHSSDYAKMVSYKWNVRKEDTWHERLTGRILSKQHPKTRCGS